MCNITRTYYACNHHIVYTRSACREQIKYGKEPACRKNISLTLYPREQRCGSCSRLDEPERLPRVTLLKIQKDEPERTELTAEELAAVEKELPASILRIPTTNWRPLPSPFYGHIPSKKRPAKKRKGSLLKEEVKPEQIRGTWNSDADADANSFASYQTVSCGWDTDNWPAETKNLTEEVEEDRIERVKEDVDNQIHDYNYKQGLNAEDEMETEEDGQDHRPEAEASVCTSSNQSTDSGEEDIMDCEPDHGVPTTDAVDPYQTDIDLATHNACDTEPSSPTSSSTTRDGSPSSLMFGSPQILNNATNLSSITAVKAKKPPTLEFPDMLADDGNAHYWYRDPRDVADGKKEELCWEVVTAVYVA